jgi:hypothetical protein
VVNALNTGVEGVNKVPELMPLARVSDFNKDLAIGVVNLRGVNGKGSIANRRL